MEGDGGKDTEKESSMENSAVNLENSYTEKDVEEPSEKEPERSPCQFFLAGRCRFGDRCRNMHNGIPEATSPPPSTRGKSEYESNSKKKPPMKTATDVISRIQWDNMLPKECFIIGYLDRFLGTIEKPFSAFCWEDLASVGHDVLAIPKHRIQYFKYKDLVVWDKNSRIDNVFGSTGSGMTILDIMEQNKNLDHEEKVNVQPEMSGLQKDSDGLEEYENVEECLDAAAYVNTKKLRPTHFIAVRISSEDVKSSIKEVQDVLKKWNPDISEYCTPLPALHLTLCLLHLETPEEIQKSVSVIQEWSHEIQRILPPSLILRFEGLKDFNARVLYLAPLAIPEISSFVQSLHERFCNEGLQVIKPPSNRLHVTVAKISTNTFRKNPGLRFYYDIYGHIPIAHFGAQHVDSISFCDNGSARRTDGFYTTLLEFSLY
ncbi:leukocyte receptor cluster member 9 [Pelobates cultripes]|uniref:Leukocyte receptor cluster member 9 n=1 Tax=Pelobates cultripes TaxID=61616 RepID=A0AAD1WN77_PELCU|nr:leukocyte receptor cluster member 9 [Pelobates cultripes]